MDENGKSNFVFLENHPKRFFCDNWYNYIIFDWIMFWTWIEGYSSQSQQQPEAKKSVNVKASGKLCRVVPDLPFCCRNPSTWNGDRDVSVRGLEGVAGLRVVNSTVGGGGGGEGCAGGWVEVGGGGGGGGGGFWSWGGAPSAPGWLGLERDMKLRKMMFVCECF